MRMRLTILLLLGLFFTLATAQQWPWSDTCFQDRQNSKTTNCSKTIGKGSDYNATNNSNGKPSNVTAMCSMVKAVKVTPKCHPGKATYFDPDSEDYADQSLLLHFLLIVMGLSGLLTLVSNGFVLYVGLRVKKRLFEKPILSLAFVDFLTGIICTPVVILTYYFRYTRATVGCEDLLKSYLKAAGYLAGRLYRYKWLLPNIVKACTCFHVLYITATRFHRLVTLSNPRNRNRDKENVHLAMIYLCAILICVISLFVEHGKAHCCKVYPHMELWMTIVLPICATIIIDIFIFRIANNYSRTKQQSKRLIKNVRAAKTTALMVGALLFCYTPLIVKWHMCGTDSFVFSLLPQVFVAANSFMNPFIYALKVPAFREIAKNYLKQVRGGEENQNEHSDDEDTETRVDEN